MNRLTEERSTNMKNKSKETRVNWIEVIVAILIVLHIVAGITSAVLDNSSPIKNILLSPGENIMSAFVLAITGMCFSIYLHPASASDS